MNILRCTTFVAVSWFWFLRHFASLTLREHLSQLRRHYGAIQSSGGEVEIVFLNRRTACTIGPADAVALSFADEPEAERLPRLRVRLWVLVAGICAEDNLDLFETTAPSSPLLFPEKRS